MEIVRPIAFGAVILAGLLLLGCDVKFQRNSESLHDLRTRLQHHDDPVSPSEPEDAGSLVGCAELELVDRSQAEMHRALL